MLLGLTIAGAAGHGEAGAAAAYFAIQAVVVAWCTGRVVVFVRDSLRAPAPPPPHASPFEAWAARYRTWVAAVCAVSCLQARM